MTKKCCRSTPRCGSCPARAIAAARKQRALNDRQALVTEIFAGGTGRQLPKSVAFALDELVAASARRP